jgi:hypothetical protein
MIEHWRPVRDFSAYEVSNHGDVRRRSTGKVLRPYRVRGISIVGLSRNGRSYKRAALRLAAIAFGLLAPNSKQQIVGAALSPPAIATSSGVHDHNESIRRPSKARPSSQRGENGLRASPITAGHAGSAFSTTKPRRLGLTIAPLRGNGAQRRI